MDRAKPAQHRPQSFACPCTARPTTEQFNIFVKAGVSANRLPRLFFFPGIFTRTRSGTAWCSWAGTEAAYRGTPMCVERRTISDRTLPVRTRVIHSATRARATSSLPLKPPSTCYPSSVSIRRTGRQEATFLWAAFRAKPLTVFSLNAGILKRCSSALTATKPETKPVPNWRRAFQQKFPSCALSRQGKTGTMLSVNKRIFRAANS